MRNSSEDLLLISQLLVFGNKQAFDQLVRKYQSAIRRFLYHLTKNNIELSNDLAQDTFIKAYTNLYHFKGIAQFSTWLYRIAYNEYYNYLRKIKDKTMVDIETTVEISNDSSFSQQSELTYDLKSALDRLNESEKTIILLYYMEELPIKDIASITHLQQNTIKSHLHRGRSKIKSFLTQYGYEEKI